MSENQLQTQTDTTKAQQELRQKMEKAILEFEQSTGIQVEKATCFMKRAPLGYSDQVLLTSYLELGVSVPHSFQPVEFS